MTHSDLSSPVTHTAWVGSKASSHRLLCFARPLASSVWLKQTETTVTRIIPAAVREERQEIEPSPRPRVHPCFSWHLFNLVTLEFNMWVWRFPSFYLLYFLAVSSQFILASSSCVWIYIYLFIFKTTFQRFFITFKRWKISSTIKAIIYGNQRSQRQQKYQDALRKTFFAQEFHLNLRGNKLTPMAS